MVALTCPSYINHVSKGSILEVVTQAVDANAASPLATLKKDAAVTGAEQTVAGTRWLPSFLRTADKSGGRERDPSAVQEEAGKEGLAA